MQYRSIWNVLSVTWVTILAAVFTQSTASSAVDDGSIEVSFVNFSSEPISFFEHNGINLIPSGTIKAYETKTVRTHMGRTFAYGENYQPDTKYTVLPKAPKVVAVGGDLAQSVPVVCSTTKGDIHMTIEPSWSPLGAGRFLQLVHTQYLDGCALNRVVPKFLTQLGIGADYDQRTRYRSWSIPDDPPQQIPFRPGTLAYAGSGPNSRSSEFFIVMPETPASQLEYFGTNPWETPFGYVHEEDVVNVVGQWYSYGDMPPWGQGPDPQLIYQKDGYEYLKREFPEMDYIETCRIVVSKGDEDVEEL
jgi:peptidyl-prolyl cis-trans isomerase A (cyclophilin A)